MSEELLEDEEAVIAGGELPACIGRVRRAEVWGYNYEDDLFMEGIFSIDDSCGGCSRRGGEDLTKISRKKAVEIFRHEFVQSNWGSNFPHICCPDHFQKHFVYYFAEVWSFRTRHGQSLKVSRI